MIMKTESGLINRIIHFASVLSGVLVGAMFLSGAGVSYIGWHPMPSSLSKAVVTIATLCAFVKFFLFLSSLFKRQGEN